MPNFIGRFASEIDAKSGLQDLSTPVQIQWQQACLLPRGSVRFVQDTSDRGSSRCRAKRWNRWYADAPKIIASEKATRNMKQRASRALEAGKVVV